jgi:hypothetical protein
MLDPEGAAKFVGTAVAADEFGRCAAAAAPAAPRKGQGGNGGGGMMANNGAPKADLLFKYGTIPACSAMDGLFAQVKGRRRGRGGGDGGDCDKNHVEACEGATNLLVVCASSIRCGTATSSCASAPPSPSG